MASDTSVFDKFVSRWCDLVKKVEEWRIHLEHEKLVLVRTTLEREKQRHTEEHVQAKKNIEA